MEQFWKTLFITLQKNIGMLFITFKRTDESALPTTCAYFVKKTSIGASDNINENLNIK
jgi:hypothetical protein